MSNKERRLLKRILFAGVLFLPALLLQNREILLNWTGMAFFALPLPDYVALALFLAAYIVIGREIVFKAVRNIARGQVFDENFLMTIATVGAFLLGEYAEGTAVMLFYQVGEFFQSYAVSRSRRSIAELMDIRPDYANIMRDGVLTQVDPEEVGVGDVIVVKPGERVPLDGVVEEGRSTLDTSALTGESAPRGVCAGAGVISGCINQSGTLTVRVSKEFGQSTVAKILELVENASDKKSASENFITKFARVYTPAVVFAAAALALVPPLAVGAPFGVWAERALTFLVISCPCALVVSVPLSFFGGIGGASRCGVLIKGGNYLELLAKADTVVFDKTGTLTKGNFAVTEICTRGINEPEFLRLAAYAENYSSHPIAASVKRAYGKTVDDAMIDNTEEIAGCGVRAFIDGDEVLVGNARLMEMNDIVCDDVAAVGTVVHLALNGKYAGYARICDELKPDAARAILDLKSAGVRRTAMLTGDTDVVGRQVAACLGLDNTFTELLPADKVERVEELMESTGGGTLVFVGDGINDAPVLARADVGIAMGGLGSDAAIEAADVVIMTDEPSKIAVAMNIGRKTLRLVRQNIVFSLGTKAIVLVLGALGYASMWSAVFADVGVTIIAVLNAIRALDVGEFTRGCKNTKAGADTLTPGNAIA